MSKDTQKILNLEFTRDFQGYTVEKTSGSKEIRVYKGGSLRYTLTCGVSWDCIGDYTEFLSAIEAANAYNYNILEYVKGYDASPAAIFGEYNKDSYTWGKDSLLNIIEQSLSAHAFTQKILDNVQSLSFENTSAVLYNGMYITPCMLEVVIVDLIQFLDTEKVNLLLSLYNCKNKKHLIDYISNNIIDDIKKNQSITSSIDLINFIDTMLV